MKKNNKKGFTLVELVIVVAVMAILVAVAIPTVGSITKSANDSVDKSNARTIESMIKLAEANASKDMENADGVAELDEDDIDTALTEAKLGITGSFSYNPTTGVVSVGESTTEGDFNITMDADGDVAEDASDDTTVEVEEVE